jgi:hypothetical protein
MSNLIKDIFATKNFPPFVLSHRGFSNKEKIEKIFPDIGLDNCEKSIEIDNEQGAKVAAKTLKTALRYRVDDKLRKLRAYKEFYGLQKTQDQYNYCIDVLKNTSNVLRKPTADTVVSNADKVAIKLSEDVVVGDKSIFRKGESALKAYNKLSTILDKNGFISLDNIDDLPEFKTFSTQNVPKLKYTIKFSSVGAEGAWDIATMSMRGITSCQTWSSGNSSAIVGSMLDPFTGIIYLSSKEETPYGSKMIRRCIVRFAMNSTTNTPVILLERMYPSSDRSIVKEFMDFLKEKVGDKYEIFYSDYGASASSIYVPLSETLEKLSQYEMPYRDSGITYKKEEKTAIANSPLLVKTRGIIVSGIYNAIKGLKKSNIPKDLEELIGILRGDNYYNDYSYTLYQTLIVDTDQYLLKNKLIDLDMSEYFVYNNLYKSLLDKDLKPEIMNILKCSFAVMPKKVHKGKTITDDILSAITIRAEELVKETITKDIAKTDLSKLSKNHLDSKLFETYSKYLN